MGSLDLPDPEDLQHLRTHLKDLQDPKDLEDPVLPQAPPPCGMLP